MNKTKQERCGYTWEGPVDEARATMEELVDQRLRNLGKPTVDRSTYKAFLHYDDMRTGREENLGGRLRILPVRYKSEMLLLLTQHDVCRSCKRTYRYFEE